VRARIFHAHPCHAMEYRVVFEMLFEWGRRILSGVVPDKRSEAERRSGTHNHRETFGEDSE